tara:strand:- start:637 stop:762 length:126 start_codon:yes stop_codon:yes gene_type:complete
MTNLLIGAAIGLFFGIVIVFVPVNDNDNDDEYPNYLSDDEG